MRQIHRVFVSASMFFICKNLAIVYFSYIVYCFFENSKYCMKLTKTDIKDR